MPQLPITPTLQSPPADVPAAFDQPVQLEQWKSDADRQSTPPPAPQPPEERIGYAVAGLGHPALEEVLPAFGQCKQSRLVALVSGNPEKMAHIARQYGVAPEHCYSYEQYDRLADDPQVQAIYIILPNAMHAEFTLRGAAAGKHILCEKPMANSVAECEAMIQACRTAGRKLMIAYRIQYEPNNRQLREWVQAGRFGKPKFVEAFNGQSSANPDHWRHKRGLRAAAHCPTLVSTA